MKGSPKKFLNLKTLIMIPVNFFLSHYAIKLLDIFTPSNDQPLLSSMPCCHMRSHQNGRNVVILDRSRTAMRRFEQRSSTSVPCCQLSKNVLGDDLVPSSVVCLQLRAIGDDLAPDMLFV